jgi:hypothetical protein
VVRRSRNAETGLKLLGTKRSDLILNQFVGGEAQSDEGVCVAPGIQYKTGGIRGVREVADLREGQSGALGEESEDLALQCSIRGEETKVVEYLADSNLLVGV